MHEYVTMLLEKQKRECVIDKREQEYWPYQRCGSTDEVV